MRPECFSNSNCRLCLINIFREACNIDGHIDLPIEDFKFSLDRAVSQALAYYLDSQKRILNQLNKNK